jgi:hypothetical protein
MVRRFIVTHSHRHGISFQLIRSDNGQEPNFDKVVTYFQEHFDYEENRDDEFLELEEVTEISIDDLEGETEREKETQMLTFDEAQVELDKFLLEKYDVKPLDWRWTKSFAQSDARDREKHCISVRVPRHLSKAVEQSTVYIIA